MNKLSILFLSILLMMVFATGGWATPVQWEISEGGNGHWYEIISDGSSISQHWTKEDYYEGTLGYLATITSQEENAWLVANIVPENAFSWWAVIGAKYSASTSSWSWQSGTGEAWSYSNWSGTAPTKTYATFYRTGTWVGTDGYITGRVRLVEYELPSGDQVPEPATMLLFGLGLLGLTGLNRKK